MKLRTDIKNEKRNNLLMVLFSVVFLFVAFKVTGQNTVILSQENYNISAKKMVTSKFPESPLIFESPKNHNDTIFMSIMADSITKDVYIVKLYAFFPKNINGNEKNITIGFNDGKYMTFGQIKYYPNENYAEYEITENSYKKLSHVTCNYILFEGISQSFVRDEKSYFIDFLASYSK